MSLMDTAASMQQPPAQGAAPATSQPDPDAAADASGADSGSQIDAQDIQALQQKIAAAVPQNMQDAFQRVITAGQKILYDPKTADMLKEDIQGGGPPDKMLVGAAGGLMSLLNQQSGGKIPPPIIVPAGGTLLLDIAKTMVQAGMQVTDQNVRDGLDQFSAMTMAHAGSSPQQIQQTVAGGGAPGAASSAADASTPPNSAAPGAPQ